MSNKLFKANWNTDSSIINISHDEIKFRGIKVLLLDVDETLIPRKEVIVNKKVKEWVDIANKYFTLHLISNNPSKKRIACIANQLNLSFTHSAGKPSRKAIFKYIISINANMEEVAIIGDRIFTDVLAGNRMGIYTILIRPINANRHSICNNKTQILEKSLANVLGFFLT